MLFFAALAAAAATSASAELGKPADGSDLSSFDDAKAEVIRLRAMLVEAGLEPTGTGNWEVGVAPVVQVSIAP